jgi:SRSO17 transposase
LIAEAQVQEAVFAGMIERLEVFVQPFAKCLLRREQQEHALDFVSGLLSDVQRKNTESIAYRHDQERKDLQHFIGQSQWDHGPLLLELARQVGQELGRADGVLVFDPSSFPKKGTESVGVQRQWCGRLGKVENCQVGVYLAYVSAEGHALVDMRLYLPREWAQDSRRRDKCHVPRLVRYRSRHELCLEMLDEQGHLLPHQWIAGDDELGRSGVFRRDLHERGERYLLAVPANTRVRDLEEPRPPRRSIYGCVPKVPFCNVERWSKAVAENAWTKLVVRDAEKGPLTVEIVKRRVQAQCVGGRLGSEELLVVIRTLDERGELKQDYYLSNTHWKTPLPELARVAKAEHRIEECFQRGKSEAGLGDYEVRSWPGWYHHQTLSLLAAWFLVMETRRGKKMDASNYLPPNSFRSCATVATGFQLQSTRPHHSRMHPPQRTKPTRTLSPLQTPQPLAPLGLTAKADLEQ